MEVVVAAIIGYALGSLVPGLWIARAKGIDIRRVGSGNIGSTNAYRAMGFWGGLAVQIIDIGKAVMAVFIARKFGVPAWGEYIVVTAAVLGHIYPIWAKFQGGKGINTLLGGMLMVEPLSSMAALGTFLVGLGLSQIVSVSSLIAVGSFIGWHGIVGEKTMIGYLMGAFWWGLVIFTHRSNIYRLWQGTEPKVGQRKR
ncbi:MAG: glycerol-3-phosphate 1-O-acyltransferase PlsY [Bacteroidia bacterium]|nr:glycerol-3-phosphate 1-O-acyltransferase PlsY [Bacteroidia bacterium]MCX7651963.1 glycerol-3-phosphate 1-O-acyltransferase PlsY [Bacteroidia bacterium]MDW8416114.1 glycerol-3-phosphate 1-O-acyltransferase PlsY [Bacteroidia bacterium]